MGSDADSLALADRLLTSVLGVGFGPISETATPTADLVSADGAHLAEVKRVTSSSLRELSHATSDNAKTTRDVAELTRRWMVALDATINSDSLPPMPKFAGPVAAERVAWESEGFTVATRAEREAEFRKQHPGPKKETVRVNGLIDDLIPYLKVLEVNRSPGDSYSWRHWFKTDEVSIAQRAILARTGGGHVSSFVVTEAPAGIDILLGWGYTRTERPNTIAGRVQTWLDSGLSTNLRDSLRPAGVDVTRHAVLVFDALSEPEFELASTDPSFVPTANLNLPPEVDTIWAVFGERALAYSAGAGWAAHPVPAAGQSL